MLRRLATAEGRTDYADRAVIEFTAAIYHFEQAKHERYCATNRHNVAMLLYKLGRYRDAHEHLDRAGATLLRLNDTGLLAQVDETRARVFVAEKKYAEADRVITRAVRTLEEGGSVTRAARLLGLKHQTLIAKLQRQHKGLQRKRTPVEKRLKSIIKELKE